MSLGLMATDKKAFLLQKRFIEFALGESGGKASDPYSYLLEKILKILLVFKGPSLECHVLQILPKGFFTAI